MTLVALTGGIAAGKSTISARLATHGAVIVDADAIVREVQQPGSPVLDAIAARFGDGMLQADGSLDRAALGGRVFGDSEALAALNAIVHPAVRELSQQRFREALAADPEAVVVYDVPLLAEARTGDDWDLVVVAEAPAEVRRRRLVENRGLSVDEAKRRIAAQATDAERRALADVVIDTGGTLEQTLAATDELWERLRGQ
ncbi:dephospho-CoA kinase [uncultured Microbacterium sp.]|uniref:dephospho-CoA kinase n=1 Tax=uncultured Microbacterium sp. TaxID=191216 RepID=UPI0025D54F50|nr:dephospho-CoA kinase [uncultured Microbacterium sp.]